MSVCVLSNRDGHRGLPGTLKWQHCVTERIYSSPVTTLSPSFPRETAVHEAGRQQHPAHEDEDENTKCFTLTTWDSRNHFV